MDAHRFNVFVEPMRLVRPSSEYLVSYVAALERGFSPNNERPRVSAEEELHSIREDAAAFLACLDMPVAGGPPVTLPDGSTVPRLPGIRRWMWDGEFAGSIGLRWQAGTPELPPHCLGHIGYSVVPWRQDLGYARQALRAMLPEARAVGLPWVELTTDVDNLASQRVIAAAGGVLVERFEKPAAYGSRPALRFRIALA